MLKNKIHTKAIVLRHIVEMNLLILQLYGFNLFSINFTEITFDKIRCEKRNIGLAFTRDQGPLSMFKSYGSIYIAALVSNSGFWEPAVQTFWGVGVGMRTV